MKDGQLEAKGRNGRIEELEGQEDLEDVEEVIRAFSGWHTLASIVWHLQNEIPFPPTFGAHNSPLVDAEGLLSAPKLVLVP